MCARVAGLARLLGELGRTRHLTGRVALLPLGDLNLASELILFDVELLLVLFVVLVLSPIDAHQLQVALLELLG